MGELWCQHADTTESDGTGRTFPLFIPVRPAAARTPQFSAVMETVSSAWGQDQGQNWEGSVSLTGCISHSVQSVDECEWNLCWSVFHGRWLGNIVWWAALAALHWNVSFFHILPACFSQVTDHLRKCWSQELRMSRNSYAHKRSSYDEGISREKNVCPLSLGVYAIRHLASHLFLYTRDRSCSNQETLTIFPPCAFTCFSPALKGK